MPGVHPHQASWQAVVRMEGAGAGRGGLPRAAKPHIACACLQLWCPVSALLQDMQGSPRPMRQRCARTMPHVATAPTQAGRPGAHH